MCLEKLQNSTWALHARYKFLLVLSWRHVSNSDKFQKSCAVDFMCLLCKHSKISLWLWYAVELIKELEGSLRMSVYQWKRVAIQYSLLIGGWRSINFLARFVHCIAFVKFVKLVIRSSCSKYPPPPPRPPWFRCVCSRWSRVLFSKLLRYSRRFWCFYRSCTLHVRWATQTLVGGRATSQGA